jgi:hypothetical protein
MLPSRRGVRRRLIELVISLSVVASALSIAGAPAYAECSAADGLGSLGLAPSSQNSSDGVAYTKWTGLIPSWDGVPLDVTVTVATDASCLLPVVSLNHGWGSEKTSFETTSATSSGSTYQWNNVWFASRGYAAVTFTARGFFASCGKRASSNGAASGLPSSCTANGRHYWIQFDDTRYSLRDLQWLLGRLVDAGVANPDRIGVTGGSMGGTLAWLAAIANDRIVCGGIGWLASNGADPCAGASMGALVPWRSPAGTSLHIAAAVPMYAWASLIHLLLPNGRASDQASGAPPLGNLRAPVGIPVQSWISSLNSMGAGAGFYEPSTTADTTSSWGTWFADLAQQINTTNVGSSKTAKRIYNTATIQWGNYKSPLSAILPVDAAVPILAVQGTTDGIATPVEAILMWQKMKEFSADYPIGMVFGDLGHAPAANAADMVAFAHGRGNELFDFFLRDAGEPQTFDVTAGLSRCQPGAASNQLEMVSATAPTAFPTSSFDVSFTGTKTTTHSGGGTESSLLGPVNIASCPSMSNISDANVAKWSWAVPDARTLVGQPQVTVKVKTTANDAQLNTRLWHLTPDGKQRLISRGTYRLAIAPSSSFTTVAYEIPASFYRFAAGDWIKLEITGYDAPHFQADSVANTSTFSWASLRMPTQ